MSENGDGPFDFDGDHLVNMRNHVPEKAPYRGEVSRFAHRDSFASLESDDFNEEICSKPMKVDWSNSKVRYLNTQAEADAARALMLDAEEHVMGFMGETEETNKLNQLSAEYRKFSAYIDSGPIESVVPKKELPEFDVKPSVGSRRGQ